MFTTKKNKLQPFEGLETEETFYKGIDSNEFPIRKYIEIKYKCCANYFYSEDIYNTETLNFLVKKGTILCSTSVGSVDCVLKNPISGIKGGTIWFYYKNIYIRISLRNQPDDVDEYIPQTHSFEGLSTTVIEEEDSPIKEPEKTFSLLFVTPTTMGPPPIEDFKNFIIENKKGNVHIFIKNQYGEYDFEPIKITNPDIDLEKNYGKKFMKIHELITSRISSSSSGLYMFHGSPGTGKTTYIRYLANNIEKNFIYVPTNMLEYLTTDPNTLSSLLTKPNSVLILEDAEKVILKREAGENSSVSSILNLSDGLMSDILKSSIILTYNCSKHSIDEALIRKGRLQVDYEFEKLDQEDAINLAKHLNIPQDVIEDKITDDMSLADIYNISKEVNFGSKPEEEKVILGFGKGYYDK